MKQMEMIVISNKNHYNPPPCLFMSNKQLKVLFKKFLKSQKAQPWAKISF